MAKRVDMQRRRRVWDEKARNPNLSGDEIAARLGLAPRTVYEDIAAAEIAVNETAANAIRAGIIERDNQIVGAHLPLALAGKTRNAEVILSVHNELRTMFGLDAEKSVAVRHVIEQAVAQLPEIPGLSTEDVIAEAERILALARQDG